LIIGITTGLGGGTIRDLVLGIEVFWFADQSFFIFFIDIVFKKNNTTSKVKLTSLNYAIIHPCKGLKYF